MCFFFTNIYGYWAIKDHEDFVTHAWSHRINQVIFCYLYFAAVQIVNNK